MVCQALGETFGPVSSSLLERNIEFRPTQKALGVGMALFLFTFILACEPMNFFRVNKRTDSE